MNDLKEIILALKSVCEETGLEVKDKIILEQSIDIFISRSISKERQRETPKEIKEQIQQKIDYEPMATDKQKYRLRQYGIPNIE